MDKRDIVNALGKKFKGNKTTKLVILKLVEENFKSGLIQDYKGTMIFNIDEVKNTGLAIEYIEIEKTLNIEIKDMFSYSFGDDSDVVEGDDSCCNNCCNICCK